MREEIEAAALFITKLVNKNLSQSNSIECSSVSSTHSSASSTTSSSSDSPPGFDDQTTTTSLSDNNNVDLISSQSVVDRNCNNDHHSDKVEQFRQCLTKALYERFHNHWFPEQPTKGQAYRCIRLNEWDRHDITLQRACSQCGIDYKDLQLPVELTLWVDPEEVTCRFGENKGSHCLVAKFKDGELKDNNLNIDDINNIDIEIFPQQQQQQQQQQHTMTAERIRYAGLQGSPDYSKQQHHHHHHNHHHQQQQHNQQHNLVSGSSMIMINNNNNNNSNNNNNNSNYHNYIHQHHQQAQHLHQTQTSPQQQHHHRSNIGKTAMNHSCLYYEASMVNQYSQAQPMINHW